MSEEKPVKCALCKKQEETNEFLDFMINHVCLDGLCQRMSVSGWNKTQAIINAYIESKEREAFAAGAYFCNSHGLSESISKFNEWKAGREK